MAGRGGARSRRQGPPTLAVAVVAVLVLALVGTLVVAVTGRSSDTALSVNGWTLSRDELRDQLEQIAANDGYRAARARNGQPLAVFRPGSTTEYDPELIVELLNERVTFQLAAEEVARRGLVATEADRDAARVVIEDGLASGGAKATATGPTGTAPTGPDGGPPGTGAAGASVLDGLGSYRDVLLAGVINLQLLQRALGVGPGIATDDAARLLYDRTREQTALQTCVRHLLVRAGPVPGLRDPNEPSGVDGATAATSVPPTEDDFGAALERANGLKARIDAGEDFASVVTRNSDDASSRPRGGDLGCTPRSRYERAFDDAAWAGPVGQVSAPVRSTYGYHLILPYERRERTFEELLPSLRAAVADQGQEALQRWLKEAASKAQVSVDSGVGRWNAEKGLVEPPGGAAALNLVPGAPGGSAPAAPPSSSVPTTAAPPTPAGPP